ncbi:MAG: hypothetical protein A2Y25_03250 [Candidatus Melainabacteria bacterium GWF2_37_15]|nr:MAG: hypothetical protein A2Y25_03250 [Candidatus Melainabacteria bacterium GWF2_37_15]
MNEAVLDKLTSADLLKKNIILNFITYGLPIGIALIAIPMIIEGFGTDRFGILTLIWTIIGYSSVFDLGLGRTLTHIVSKHLGTGDTKDLNSIIWTSLFIISIMGILVGAVVCLITPLIVKLINAPQIYVPETTRSIYLLGLSIPFLIGILSLKGILEAYQQFAVISIMRLPIVFFNYLVPLIVLVYTTDLSVTVAFLVIGRILTFIAHLVACSFIIKGFFTQIKFKKDYIKPLMSFGGWITVSNVISPIMGTLDRFFISALLSATVVAFYTTPQNVIFQLEIIPAAILGVMFPAFSVEYQKNRERAKRLYYRSIKYMALLLFFPALFIIIFAKPGLALWINEEFAGKSYKIAQMLAIGMFIYCVNHTSVSLIQSTGRSDITAKIHLFELPIYLGALVYFIKTFGLIGATFAWLLRVSIDSVLLHFWTRRLLRSSHD